MRYALAFVRSTLFATIFYGLTVLFVLTATAFAPVSERAMRKVVNGWGHFHRALCRVVLRQKVKLIGQLPPGPALYVFKHESMFETIDLLCLFVEPVPVAKQELINIPAWGVVARRYGAIGLRRDTGSAALRHLKREAMSAVRTGRPICLFPEGTRVPHGERPPLKAGFAALYKLLGLPVVPVAVDSGRLAPRNSFIKRAGIITYLVGETIPPGLPRAQAEARTREAINALNSGTI